MTEHSSSNPPLMHAGHLDGSHRVAAASPPGVQLLYVVTAFMLFATHLDIYLNHLGALPFNPLVLLATMCALGIPIFLWPETFDGHLADFLAALRSNAWPIVLFFLWLSAHLVFLGAVRLDSTDVDFTHVFPLIQFGLMVFGLLVGTMPGAASTIRTAGICAFILLASTMLYDAVLPGTFSIVVGRSAGLGIDPNVSAFCLLALLAVSLRWKRPSTVNLLLLVVSLVAILSTFSRGGLILWAVAFLVYAGQLLRTARVGFVAASLLGVASVTVLLVWLAPSTSLMDIPEVNERLSRLTLQADLVDLDDSRVGLLLHYLDQVMTQPLLGYGTGAMDQELWRAPFEQGPHNMYVRVWFDHGLWGLLTYVGVLASATAIFLQRGDGRGLCFIALAWVYGIVSHTVIDDKTFLLLLGVTLALSTPKPLEPGGVAGRDL